MAIRSALVVVIVALSLLAHAPGSGAGTRRCFGAAARDPEHPCLNRRLRLTVTPSPSAAPLIPSAPCVPLEDPARPCVFGVSDDLARAHVALIGDSHAVHWRAALQVVAVQRQWQAVSLDRSQCPYSAATPALPEPQLSGCLTWRQEVEKWLERHPEVTTVFVSEHVGAAIRVSEGQNPHAAAVAGYVQAWSRLPASVQQVIVIRDVPHDRYSTPDCVKHAVEKGRSPGRSCAIPRSEALPADPAAEAAIAQASPRVRVVDLTAFMCSQRVCLPVVGGVLVHRDRGHLTRTFATTLGPFLRRAVDPLIPV